MVHAQIRVTGQVQGVGFRPFVFRLANELGLAGWVRNDSEGVEIAVEGDEARVMRMVERLKTEPPALARVEKVAHDITHSTTGLLGFCIAESRDGRVLTGIAPDMAICPECLAELFDPANRRYRHPFINCIHCGPRYTLTARLPYDRANTSMAKFDQCIVCQLEYDTPSTRRFHAQPNCCPKCGPRLALFDAQWQPVVADDMVAETASRISDGEVVAVKGLGGFHLVCDARNAETVAKLRGGKQREQKPFAVMVLNTASARLYAQFREQDAALLETGERPIVLLRKSPACDDALQGIATGLAGIGLILPYTPLHYLLFHELLGRPEGTDWLKRQSPLALVLTSANPGGEPLVKDDAEARESLSGLADAFLTHDRDILHRCDDSVMKWQGKAPTFVRRARGYTPRRIKLPYSGPSVLACGGWLKNTVCLTRGDEAFVSQHIGDLDHAGTRAMLDETVDYLIDILDVQPQAVAHDLHPDFYSTQYAERYAGERGLPLFPVQHHHAHIAALCAEHRVIDPVIGLALDGVGLGHDGGAWGGELLQLRGTKCERVGHLAPLAMPGGDRAAREPWRMAAAALHRMGRAGEIARRFAAQPGAEMIADMLESGVNCPATTSMGRLFDAAAGLLGVSATLAYEGQAAMLLEGLAERHGRVAALKSGYSEDARGMLDFGPLLEALADCEDSAFGAALFHATLAEGLCGWAQRATGRGGIQHVALGGGCFLNKILTQSLTDSLTMSGLNVMTAQQLPPNDGAVALGQAAVALQQLNQGA